jgi:hypothetical protein
VTPLTGELGARLQWVDNSTDEEGFRVNRVTTNAIIGTLPPNTTFTDAVPGPGGYCYEVIAFRGTVEAESNTAYVNLVLQVQPL